MADFMDKDNLLLFCIDAEMHASVGLSFIVNGALQDLCMYVCMYMHV